MNYQGNIKCKPDENYLYCDIYLKYEFHEDKNQLLFYLHKNINIQNIESDKILDYQVKEEVDDWCPNILESKPITIHLNKVYHQGEKIIIHFVYEGYIGIVSKWTMNRITPEFIELGLYTPYFPLTPTFDHATFRFNVDLPENYELINGKRVNNKWIIEVKEPTNDCTLVAAKDFKKYPTSFDLTIYYIDQKSQKMAKKIQQMSEEILELYNHMFSPRVIENKMSLVILPRKYGGAYVRPTLMVFSEIVEEKDLPLRFLAHELSHLWWNKAFPNSWEDWLNESFAEYSALMIVRNFKGEQAFKQVLDKFKKQSENTPAIYGIKRGDDASTKVLYQKGPLVLNKLENQIGNKQFLHFMKEVHQNEIKTTSDLLKLLTQLASKETSEMLLNELMK